MSLTAYLTGKSSQALRSKLMDVFPTPTLRPKGDILAQPITNNYSLVGGAFDYLLRFHIERINESCLMGVKPYVAEASYLKLASYLKTNNKDLIYCGYGKTRSKQEPSKVLNSLKKEYKLSSKNIKRFKEVGVVTDDLLRSCILFAKLDAFFRAHYVYPDYSYFDDGDLKDLRQILHCVNFENFKAKEYCLLNPTFGKGSELVFGADADMVIDSTLIEIKVVKSNGLRREYLNQLLCYYILSLIGGIDGYGDSKIDSIGIYYARHGVFWKISLDEIAEMKVYEEVKDWFVNHVKEYPSFLSDEVMKFIEMLEKDM